MYEFINGTLFHNNICPFDLSFVYSCPVVTYENFKTGSCMIQSRRRRNAGQSRGLNNGRQAVQPRARIMTRRGGRALTLLAAVLVAYAATVAAESSEVRKTTWWWKRQCRGWRLTFVGWSTKVIRLSQTRQRLCEARRDHWTTTLACVYSQQQRDTRKNDVWC